LLLPTGIDEKKIPTQAKEAWAGHPAVALVLEANRTLAQEAASGKDVIREPLTVTA
jgi:hypothetical protein